MISLDDGVTGRLRIVERGMRDTELAAGFMVEIVSGVHVEKAIATFHINKTQPGLGFLPIDLAFPMWYVYA